MYLTAAGSGLGLDPVVVTSRQYQESPFSAGVVDRHAHERVDQILQVISRDTASDTLITVAKSRCSADVWIVPIASGSALSALICG